MQLEVITPETILFTGEADAVQLPGVDGSFQVLNTHAPIISTLKKGTIKVDLHTSFVPDELLNEWIYYDAKNTKVIRMEIKGGVAELTHDKLIVLAE